MPLLEYIEKHYGGNRSDFARACGVSRAQVNQWLKAEYIAHNGRLYSPKGKEKDFVIIKKHVYEVRKQKLPNVRSAP